jgi:hypothetical protein
MINNAIVKILFLMFLLSCNSSIKRMEIGGYYHLINNRECEDDYFGYLYIDSQSDSFSFGDGRFGKYRIEYDLRNSFLILETVNEIMYYPMVNRGKLWDFYVNSDLGCKYIKVKEQL